MDTAYQWLDTLLGLQATRAADLSVAQTCARAFIVYLVLIAYARLGKKRFLGEATAFDVILLIIIGALSGRTIAGAAPLASTLAAILLMIAMHWVMSYATRDWPALGILLKGHDTVLIRNGRVDHKALAAAHMAMDDLSEDLRQQGVEDPRDVKEARLERSGKLSVIKK
ncbi:MAG TPA: YetF domain-containing protein [Pseudolabrys sp.]|jgi:uncharacterized membrane protein YcaP (DUF421 family)|nr:YetF domain-containing protein [Pseudolabrys sp.]